MSTKISEQDISKLKTIIEHFSKSDLTSNESNTKKRIIEPLLEILGWDFFSNEIRLEHPVGIGTSKTYVDYALMIEGKTVVFIEAKSFDTELSETYSSQIISYGKVDDVRWAALTNGKVIKIFDTNAGKSEKECLIGEVTFEKLPHNLEELLLLHRDSILTGEIELAVERLTTTRASIKILEQKRDQLAEEFQTSLLKITGDVLQQRAKAIAAQLVNRVIQLLGNQLESISERELMRNNSIFHEGIKIFLVYKGKRYEALFFNSRKLIYENREYSSPSRLSKAITGTARNGWRDWKYVDKQGSVKLIDVLRTDK
jgi:hypothetical protein